MPPKGSRQTKLSFATEDSRKKSTSTRQSASRKDIVDTNDTTQFTPAGNNESRKRPPVPSDDADTVRKKSKTESDKPEASQPEDRDIPSTLGFTVDEAKGDLFASAPTNAVLIHACNCQGSWGGGIALAFRSKYPKAYKIYRDFCQTYVQKHTTKTLLGTAQLISPVDGGKTKHFIGCLFTSDRYGRAKDSPRDILEATKSSMEHLISQINDWNDQHEEIEKVTALYMCKINSGLFSVPWKDSKALLEGLDTQLPDMKRVFMVRDRN